MFLPIVNGNSMTNHDGDKKYPQRFLNVFTSYWKEKEKEPTIQSLHRSINVLAHCEQQ